MPLFEITADSIQPVTRTTFIQAQMHERRDLQRVLRENVSVVAPDTMVIAEEFGDWEDSRRRIDLLGVDRDANLVVIELKRTEDGGHMELQAIRYAAMISAMTFDKAAEVYDRYLKQLGQDDVQARSDLLDFLGWTEAETDAFGSDVRIVLASAEFGPELTTSVLWLADRGIDIRCVRLQPYALGDKMLVDVQQIIPLPEAADYQVRIREKSRKEREARVGGADHSRYELTIGDRHYGSGPKRRIILQVFLHLARNGEVPEHIAGHCGPRANRALIGVDGDVGQEEFVRLATMARAGRFDPIRYFCADDELLHREGRTYAFLNQWGGEDWLAAMNGLRSAFPHHRIDFVKSE
ncbi:MAG: hypothetical protein KDK24_01170 [Pseudooceanicola sp.]|nr:hypothetical protein [Pseudooceanicola sp.]